MVFVVFFLNHCLQHPNMQYGNFLLVLQPAPKRVKCHVYTKFTKDADMINIDLHFYNLVLDSINLRSKYQNETYD
jgi:hypothetical protein